VLHRTPDRLSIWGRSAKNGATVDDTLYDLTGIVNAFGPYQSRPCDVATIKPRRKNPLNVEMSHSLRRSDFRYAIFVVLQMSNRSSKRKPVDFNRRGCRFDTIALAYNLEDLSSDCPSMAIAES
jgi:hypothetical protein